MPYSYLADEYCLPIDASGSAQWADEQPPVDALPACFSGSFQCGWAWTGSFSGTCFQQQASDRVPASQSCELDYAADEPFLPEGNPATESLADYIPTNLLRPGLDAYHHHLSHVY